MSLYYVIYPFNKEKLSFLLSFHKRQLKLMISSVIFRLFCTITHIHAYICTCVSGIQKIASIITRIHACMHTYMHTCLCVCVMLVFRVKKWLARYEMKGWGQTV